MKYLKNFVFVFNKRIIVKELLHHLNFISDTQIQKLIP